MSDAAGAYKSRTFLAVVLLIVTVVGSITILTTYLLPSPSNVRKSIDRFAGRVKQVYLEVRPSNKAGILLYHKLSFEETGKVMRKYYPDGEDAIEMERAV